MAGNMASAAALGFGHLLYEPRVKDDLIHQYGEKLGLELANVTLNSISALKDFPGDQRNFTLQQARQETERNIREADYAPAASAIALLVLCYMGRKLLLQVDVSGRVGGEDINNDEEGDESLATAQHLPHTNASAIE